MAENQELEVPAYTAKNVMFCRLILEGHPTVEAHKMAGYKGDPHAAYELRSKLRGLLRVEAEKRGISMEGVAADLAQLDNLPVNASHVGVTEKLAIINAKRKFLEAEAPPAKPKDMPRFVIDVDPEPVEGEKVESAAPAQTAPSPNGGVETQLELFPAG